MSEETFHCLKKYKPGEYFRDCFGIIRDDKLPPQRTVLRVDALQVPYLRNLPLHHSQKTLSETETHTDFEFYIAHTYDFIQEIMSKGASVEVIEPESLRSTIRTEVKRMQKRYEL